MINSLKIVLPMAGKGQRFKDKGVMEPKPLIDVAGVPMAKRAAMSLDFFNTINPKNIICVVRTADVEQYDIATRLESIFGSEINIIEEQNPVGAATSVLASKALINNSDRLLVMDCDVTFHSSEYESKIIHNDESIDGMIPTFLCEGRKWSFSRFGSDRRITEIAEKIRISDYANIGCYYFSKGSIFVEYTEKIIKNKNTIYGEYYISLVMKEMIEAGMFIYAAIAEEFNNMGTPEDLEFFIKKIGAK